MITLLSLLSITFIGRAISIDEEVGQCTSVAIAAWYDGSTFSGAAWTDKSGNSVNGQVTHGSVSKYDGSSFLQELDLNGRPVVYGAPGAQIVFNTNVGAAHTVFNLCKYREVGSTGRIINGVSCNCLFGHHGSVAGVAYEEGWISSGSIGVTPRTDWVLSSQTSHQYRANGQDRTEAPQGGRNVGNLAIALGPGFDAVGAGQVSNWACAELLVFYEELPLEDIQCIEGYFSCKYGIPVGADGDTCDLCDGVTCSDTPCQTSECNILSGECDVLDIDCDDENECTVDSCDAETGCVNEDTCGDGDACNGEEYCDAGECKAGDDLVCAPGFVCNSDAKGCVRDCGHFSIDGYLRDCSLEWNDNEIELAGLQASDEAFEIRISDNEDALIERYNEIVKLQDEDTAISVILGEYVDLDGNNKEPVYAQLEALNARLDIFMPVVEYDETDTYQGQTAAADAGFLGIPTDELVVFLLLSNMVLFSVIIVIVLCYCKYKLRDDRKYERVKYYSSAGDEDHQKLKS